MKITLNGEEITTQTGSIKTLIDTLGLDARKIAVERNLEIIPRGEYGSISLQAGDNIEIIHFIGGG